MVTTQEVLEQLTLANLKKIVKRMGIRVPQGFTGMLAQAGLGIESRGPYIRAIENSGLVTLEEIDRILGTRYAKIHNEAGREPFQTQGPRPERTAIVEPRRLTPDTFPTAGSIVRHAMDRYLSKDDIQAICADLNLPTSGNKPDLIYRVLGDSRFEPRMALVCLNKDDLKRLSNELGILDYGTRADLEDRVLYTISSRSGARSSVPQPKYPETPPIYPPSSYVPHTQPPTLQPTPPAYQPPVTPATPRPGPQPEQTVTQEATPEALNERAEMPAKPLIPEPIAPQVAQLKMVTEFLEEYRPSQRFQDEQAYQIELAAEMRNRFGRDNVKVQAYIPGGRIDLEVLGIGVELKVPSSRGNLQTLWGQAQMYKGYYGPNLAVVIFNDFARTQDLSEFTNRFRDLGMRVFVK